MVEPKALYTVQCTFAEEDPRPIREYESIFTLLVYSAAKSYSERKVH